jgi:hypothetical protein
LLDWFAVLCREPVETVLAELPRRLLFPQVLLKSWEDHMKYMHEVEAATDGGS